MTCWLSRSNRWKNSNKLLIVKHARLMRLSHREANPISGAVVLDTYSCDMISFCHTCLLTLLHVSASLVISTTITVHLSTSLSLYSCSFCNRAANQLSMADTDSSVRAVHSPSLNLTLRTAAGDLAQQRMTYPGCHHAYPHPNLSPPQQGCRFDSLTHQHRYAIRLRCRWLRPYYQWLPALCPAPAR